MPAKKNILLVSYYFPPLGMGGVGRSRALYKYLPKHGYNVMVLTVKNIVFPEYDDTLLRSDDRGSIIRTGSLDPARLLYLLGFRKTGISGSKSSILSSLFFPDSKRGWNSFALRKAKEIIKSNDIAAVITTSPPPSSHIIGLQLKTEYGIRWIADFRDFWFSLPVEYVYSSQNKKSKALALIRNIIDTADEVVSVNNSIREYMGRGEVIMNGADINTAQNWKVNGNIINNKFIIGILGTINHLTPIEPLFKAVNHIINKNPVLESKISIVHVGHIDKDLALALLDKYSLNDVVTLHGYLPEAKAIETLAGSDMLYFSVNRFDNFHILPGRIFYYLMSGLPILGVVPKGSDAAALLNEYQYGKVLGHDEIAMMSEYILEVYHRKSENKPRQNPDLVINYKYSTAAMTEEYAELLNRIL